MDNEESVYSSSKSAFCAYIWMANLHLGAVAAYFAERGVERRGDEEPVALPVALVTERR